jgi:CheY-like chemotaxis protein
MPELPKEAGKGKQILVIDDDPMMRDLLLQFLQADGYRVITAADGREGLAQARSLQPDLVLLDISMPAPNGLEVCATLKREAATAQMPVLFISARLTAHDVEQMKAAGASGFLSKPFSLVEMRRAINLVLGLRAGA